MKIEFRGKEVKTGEWRYGVPILNSYGEKSFICIATSDKFTFPLGVLGRLCHEVDHKTVGQYTNVNTHRGEKIFEGDVVSVEIDDGQRYGTFIGVVEFLEGAWWVDNELMQKAVLLWNESNEIEILGNIHDNPELLEVSE